MLKNILFTMFQIFWYIIWPVIFFIALIIWPRYVILFYSLAGLVFLYLIKDEC